MRVQLDSKRVHRLIDVEGNVFFPFFERGEEVFLDLCASEEDEVGCVLPEDLQV